MLSQLIRNTLLSSALLLSWVPTVALSQPTATEQPLVGTNLVDLNQAFLSFYRAQTPSVIAQLPLIVVIRSDGVTAIEPNQKTHYDFSPGIMEIKSALHAVLGYQGVMTELAMPHSAIEWSEANRYLSSLIQLKTLIPDTQASPSAKQGTMAVISQLEQATRTAITRQTVEQQDVATTLAAVEPAVMAVLDEIGELSVQAMIATLQAIQEKVSVQTWEKVVIVVPGPATARMNNLGLAAAADVLGEEALGERIFYSEAIYDDTGIQAYVQLLMRDKRFSTLMFDQPHRMWRDVFADTSRQYLDQDTQASLAR